MEYLNFKILLIVALIPLLISKVWYAPKVFGGKLHNSLGLESKNTNHYFDIFLMYLYGLFVAYMLCMIVVHQFGFFLLHFNELFIDGVSSESILGFSDFMNTQGHKHRTLGHGLIHGVEAGLLMGLFFIGTLTIIEKRPFKSLMIHLGFFITTFGIMGALISAYL